LANYVKRLFSIKCTEFIFFKDGVANKALSKNSFESASPEPEGMREEPLPLSSTQKHIAWKLLCGELMVFEPK